MTDRELQRRINRQLDVDGIKDKAVIAIAVALGVLILWAYVATTEGKHHGGRYEQAHSTTLR